MRIAVTGREGQIAQALAGGGWGQDVTVILVGRPDLDLAISASIYPALRDAKPDVVVNAAAYTAVDKAETEPELAHLVNATGAGAVAEAAAKLDLPIVHLSTDYVFDGSADRPYREDDPTGPLGVYGHSKLAGERAVAAANSRHVILRTAWVYSPFGQNFVKTMLRLAATREEVGVVADQHGCPTSAIDIAHVLIEVAKRVAGERNSASPIFGTFHMTAQGHAVWADVAEAVFARSAALGGPQARVNRITTEAYPTPARRPANSRLDGGKLASVYGITLPVWRESLDTCVASLLGAGRPIAQSSAAAKPPVL